MRPEQVRSASQRAPEVSLERLMLAAILDGDSAVWEGRLLAWDSERAFRALLIGGTAAVFRKWPQAPGGREVEDYVASIPEVVSGALPVSQDIIVALVRGMLGQKELVKSLPKLETLLGALIIILVINRELLTGPGVREDYLDEVEATCYSA